MTLATIHLFCPQLSIKSLHISYPSPFFFLTLEELRQENNGTSRSITHRESKADISHAAAETFCVLQDPFRQLSIPHDKIQSLHRFGGRIFIRCYEECLLISMCFTLLSYSEPSKFLRILLMF